MASDIQTNEEYFVLLNRTMHVSKYCLKTVPLSMHVTLHCPDYGCVSVNSNAVVKKHRLHYFSVCWTSHISRCSTQCVRVCESANYSFFHGFPRSLLKRSSSAKPRDSFTFTSTSLQKASDECSCRSSGKKCIPQKKKTVLGNETVGGMLLWKNNPGWDGVAQPKAKWS